MQGSPFADGPLGSAGPDRPLDRIAYAGTPAPTSCLAPSAMFAASIPAASSSSCGLARAGHRMHGQLHDARTVVRLREGRQHGVPHATLGPVILDDDHDAARLLGSSRSVAASIGFTE